MGQIGGKQWAIHVRGNIWVEIEVDFASKPCYDDGTMEEAMSERQRITNWVGYSNDMYRDVFCAALTGLLANATYDMDNPNIHVDVIKQANDITNEFFTQQNLNR